MKPYSMDDEQGWLWRIFLRMAAMLSRFLLQRKRFVGVAAPTSLTASYFVGSVNA